MKPPMKKSATKQQKLNWIKDKQSFIESLDPTAVALLMIKEGLFSPKSNVNDIVVFLKKNTGQQAPTSSRLVDF
jgi:hypothetical protein